MELDYHQQKLGNVRLEILGNQEISKKILTCLKLKMRSRQHIETKNQTVALEIPKRKKNQLLTLPEKVLFYWIL